MRRQVTRRAGGLNLSGGRNPQSFLPDRNLIDRTPQLSIVFARLDRAIQ
jgi:hypothetical protein